MGASNCAMVFGVAITALGGCVTSDPVCKPDCTDNDVCVRGTCEDAFDRDWTFTAVGIDVATTEPDGTMWDASDDSPPDPYAILALNGATILQTKVVSDTYTAEWNQTSTAVDLPETNMLQITATDSDTFGGGDQILQLVAPITADMLRAGQFAFTMTNSTITIAFHIAD